MPDLADITDALYAELPARFTAARGEAVKQARSAGDRGLAAEVGRLPKPPISAWAVNALVRHRGDLMDGFVGLGQSLREAQDDLDADSLRTLTAQRRKVVAQLATEAQRLGEQLGQNVSDAARDDVEKTLQAALADPAAASAVATGRLVRPLEATGFDAVNLEGAVAGGEGGAPARRSSRSAAPARDDLAEARERKRRELDERTRERDAAATTHAEAAESLSQVTGQFDDAVHARDGLRARVEELERELEQVNEDLARASSNLRKLTTRKDDAEDAESRAARALSRAEERLASLERRSR